MRRRPGRYPVMGAAAARTWRTSWLVAAGLLVLLVVAVVAAEIAGWPFLAKPVQQALSDKLGREVRLAADAGAPAQLSTRFFGGVRLRANHLWIAAPSWSEAPHTVAAQGLALQMRVHDLWRAWRGERLRITAVQADVLDAHLERLADGRSSWRLDESDPPADADAPAGPQVGLLEVNGGRIRFADVKLDADIDARVSLAGIPGSDPATGGAAHAVLRVQAKGRFKGNKLVVDWVSRGAMPLSADDALAAPVAVQVTATVGRAKFAFDGTAHDVLNLAGMDGRFDLGGPSLAAVGDALGVTLPTTTAFRIRGGVARKGALWNVVVDDATVGSSSLNGAFTYDTRRATPELSGRLGGARLYLVDLGPAVGADPGGKQGSKRGPDGRVLPTRSFDLPSLRAMAANVLIDIREVDLNTSWLAPLRPLKGHLTLADGILSLRDLEARTADGRLHGEMRLDGRAERALWSADLRWSGVALERWIRQTRPGNAPPYVSGRVHGRARVSGEGRSTAAILGSLEGPVQVHLTGGRISHLALEFAGIDLAEGLGVMVRGDRQLPVSCAVADLVAKQGIIRPRVMVVDTTDSLVMVTGEVSLSKESLDLRAVVTPKDFSPMSLRTPLRVQGPFANPQVSLEKGPLGAKVASALVLGLLNPLAALIPLIDAGGADTLGEEAAACRQLARRAPGKGAAPAGN